MLPFRAPYSYTGEDLVEFHIPASPTITGALLSALLEQGCTPAGPGEFTRRAFENGKLDLTQAEGVLALIESVDSSTRRAAFDSLHGELSKRMLKCRELLLDVLSGVEANLDFADEDIRVMERDDAGSRIRSVLTVLAEPLRLARARSGTNCTVVVCGPPNVGKTTLLNALTLTDALVSPVPGTTTDSRTISREIRGVSVDFLDTPGMPHSQNCDKDDSITCSETALRSADAALLVFTAQTTTEEVSPLLPILPRNLIAVCNKADLSPGTNSAVEQMEKLFGGIAVVSALTGQGLDLLTERIGNLVGDMTVSGRSALSERQIASLTVAERDCRDALASLESGRGEEMVAVPLREAISALGEMAGREVTEEVLARVFSRFCIGK